MPTANRGFLALLMMGLAAGTAAGCGGDSSARSATSFGGASGAGAASGSAGVGATAGSGGGGGSGGVSGNVGQGGFVLAGGGGSGANAGATSAAGGASAAGGSSNGSGGDTAAKYPTSAAGSGAWASWTGISTTPCSGAGCGTPDGGSGDGESVTCAGDAQEGGAITLDVLIVFDNSSSMKCDTADQGCPDNPTGATSGESRIGAVRNAINGFVSATTSAEIRAGLIAFPPADPLASQCDWDYSKPDIAIAPAKDNVTTFATVLGGLTPHLNTPTEQALTGAYAAAKTYMKANPGRSVAVVLVTDGMPFACDNDKTGAASAAIAKAAFEGSPSIQTYVVGMGQVATLDAIALAGSGNATHYIEANADATAKIQALLNKVTSTISCDYKLPTGGAVLDFGEVNVKTKVDNAAFIDLFKVANAAACGTKAGWFYDVEPNGLVVPSKISLCPASCDPLKAAKSSSMQIVIGCATLTVQ
jgi:hypothetical protein